MNRNASVPPLLALAGVALLALFAQGPTPGGGWSLPLTSDLPTAIVDDDSHVGGHRHIGVTPLHFDGGTSVGAATASAASSCDKDVDLTGSIAGATFVAAQDNLICWTADIDVYEDGGDWYIAQAGGHDAAFTLTRFNADATLTMVSQVIWAAPNVYTPDVKAFRQGATPYIALGLERRAIGAPCGVVIVDVSDPIGLTEDDVVGQYSGPDWCDVHNLFVENDSAGDGRYIYLTANLPKDLRVLDIGDLGDVTEVGRYTHPEASSQNYVHDVTVIDHGGAIGRRVYVSYWDAGLMLLEAEDITPGVIEPGSPNQPLNPDHSLDPAGFRVHHAYPSEDGTRVFIQDEFLDATGEQPVQMWDVESPAAPAYVDGIPLGSALMPLVNPTHNLHVQGDMLYAGWYKGGLQAFRFDGDGFIERPIYHQVQTETADDAYDGAWGVRLFDTGGQAYVAQSDRRYGLIVDNISDSDGDGFVAQDEDYIGTGATEPCGTDGWPADIVDGTLLPNGVDIQDLTAYITPDRYLGTNVNDWPDPAPAQRRDIVPGPSGLPSDINVLDLTILVVATPPMLAGERNFGATCPFPP